MKFLSLRTVYRVFPIIKHSKTFGPRPVPTPGPIDLKKIFSLFVSSRTINMPNFIEIGWEMREKSRDAGELERKIRKYNKKRKNRTKTERSADFVRQTLISLLKCSWRANYAPFAVLRYILMIFVGKHRVSHDVIVAFLMSWQQMWRCSVISR